MLSEDSKWRIVKAYEKGEKVKVRDKSKQCV